MIARSSSRSVMPSTNDLSILITSTGSRYLSLDSEEWPTPKSSIAIRTPSRFRRRSTACAASGSSMIAVSVISRHSADAGRPLTRSASSTTRARLGLESWRGLRLTAMTKSGWPAARHSAAWRQAVLSTHSPIGTIRPLCSAIGMKVAGEIIPCTGCCQRSSASMPYSEPSASRISDW